MDYREHLRQPLSKHFVDHLAQEIFVHPEDFNLVYQLIFDTDEKVAWRAAWACQKISEKQPKLFHEEQFHEIATLAISTSHDGLHRGCLCVLNNLPIPDPIPVELLNHCFDWMISTKSPIAVQALSLKLLYKFCLIEPDLIPELKAYLENFETGELSAGMIATRKNILKQLNTK